MLASELHIALLSRGLWLVPVQCDGRGGRPIVR